MDTRPMKDSSSNDEGHSLPADAQVKSGVALPTSTAGVFPTGRTVGDSVDDKYFAQSAPPVAATSYYTHLQALGLRFL